MKRCVSLGDVAGLVWGIDTPRGGPMQGEVSEQAKPSIQSLQEYLSRVVGQEHTDKDPLD